MHKDIDDQLRANADSNFNLDRDATEFVTNQLLLKRDLDWTDAYFKTGVWATEKTGVASAPTSGQFLQWSDAGVGPARPVANLRSSTSSSRPASRPTSWSSAPT